MNEMYHKYKFLNRQHIGLLQRIERLEEASRHIEGEHTFLNLNESGQWFVELSGEKAREIIRSEIKEVKDELIKIEFELFDELEIILAKKKMIAEALEDEKTTLDELFKEEGE